MQKFNNEDRAMVVSELEHRLSARLTRSERYDRVLCDQHGKLFWVLGGYGDWHGITMDMIRSALGHPVCEKTLVIAKRYPARVDIYAGPLQILVERSSELHLRSNGDRHFNIHISGNKLEIKEIDGFFLDKFSEIRSQSEAEDLRRMISRMAPSERHALFSHFSESQRLLA